MPATLGILALAATLTATPIAHKPETVQVRMRDGSRVEVPAPPSSRAARPRIVEFRQAPGVLKGTLFDRFRRDLSGAVAASATENGRPRAAVPTREFHRTFRGVAVTLDDAQADAVRRFAYVKAVHEDGEVQAFAEDTTRITRIRADRVWNELKSRGEGIRVAVIDTGIDYNHPALAARYLAGGIDFVDGDDDPMDEHGHGTHVAGIVAGDSADVQGVAPAARVMAYRVLDEYGRGSDSTVIAGIERAVDPNGDGDLSDRVDIINLSLGGYGDADDPVSQSVDRAVMAGVVVFAAAGNTPGGQTIGSPAAARLAITVGNSDRDDVMHPTSSSGPSFPDFSMKPELAAPGEAIRSAKRGGGTLVASGTSMASPHAAGVAALLLALHRDWTPADVKAALTASAKPLDTEVMRQGAGRIDAYGAATVPAAIAPAVLSIGRSPSKDAWTTTRTVRITNRAAEARTFTAKAVVPGGVQMTVEPPAFTLDPGASRDVLLRANVGADVETSTMTMSAGGRVEFTAGDATVHVPWIAVQAAVATVENVQRATAFWGCEGPTSAIGRFTEGGLEALLPLRRCDLMVWGYGEDDEPKLVVQSHDIRQDVRLNGSFDQAIYAVRLRGVDEKGQPLVEQKTDERLYYVLYRIDFPRLAFQSIITTTFATEPFRVSALSEDVTVSTGEALFDMNAGRIINVHHPELHGIDGDETITSLAGDLHHVRVQVPPRAFASLQGTGIGYDSEYGPFVYAPASLGVPLDNGWSGNVYVNRDAGSKSTLGVGFSFMGAKLGDFGFSQAVRAVDGRIVMSSETVPAPGAYSVAEGGTLHVFRRPLFASTWVDTSGTDFRAFVTFTGPAQERDGGAGMNLAYTVRDGSGAVLEQGLTDYYLLRDFGQKGLYRVDAQSVRAHVAISFDTSRDDFNPPSLSSMRIEGNRVLFSVVDMQIVKEGEGFVARDVGDLQSVRLSWRNATGAWQEVPMTKLREDRGDYATLGHQETGAHYAAELPATGEVDLRFELTDRGGNASVVTLDDVFDAAPRRRAVRR